MPVTIEKLPDEPIVLITYTEPLQTSAALREAAQYLAGILDEGQHTEIYRIDDLSNVKMTFSRIVQGMGTATRKSPGSVRDARVRSLLVGGGDLIKFIAESMQQDQYGGMNMPLYTSMSEALKHVRSEIVDLAADHPA